MRHRWAHRKLGRKTEHRIATLRSLATALFTHERIETTLGKARELRPFAEKLITTARLDSVHSRRMVARDIHKKEIVQRLFREVAPRYLTRPGGYTRIMKMEARRGDAAEMAVIELVDRPEQVAKVSAPESDKPSKSALERGAERVKKKLSSKKAEAPKQRAANKAAAKAAQKAGEASKQKRSGRIKSGGSSD